MNSTIDWPHQLDLCLCILMGGGPSQISKAEGVDVFKVLGQAVFDLIANTAVGSRIQRLLLLALLATLTGCAYVDKPEGDKPLDLQGQQAAWSGQWFDGKMLVHTRVVDAAGGVIQAAWIDIRNDEFQLQQKRLLLRRTGDQLFANAEIVPGSSYLPLRITKSPRSFVIWGLLSYRKDSDAPGLLKQGQPELYESSDYKVFIKLAEDVPPSMPTQTR